MLVFLFKSLVVYANDNDGLKVNNWVQLALNYPEDELVQNFGKYGCQDALPKADGSPAPVLTGKKVEEAHGRAVIYCIKQFCNQIQSRVNQQIDEWRTKSPEEIDDVAGSLGQGDKTEDILALLRSGSYGGETNCQVSQSARYIAYDSCSIHAYKCGRVK
jgi:hypothetical protein